MKNISNTRRKHYLDINYMGYYPVVVTVIIRSGILYAMFEQMSPEWCKTLEIREDMGIAQDNGGFTIEERNMLTGFMIRHKEAMRKDALGELCCHI